MVKGRLHAALAVALCLAAPLAPDGASVVLAQQAATSGVFHGVGVVMAIDPSSGALTLDHGEIKGFMGAMEMMYRVDPSALSARLHVGDRVAFDIDGARETIVGVTVLGPAK